MKIIKLFVLLLFQTFLTTNIWASQIPDIIEKSDYYKLAGATLSLIALESLQPCIGPEKPRWIEPPLLDRNIRNQLIWKNKPRAALFSDLFATTIGFFIIGAPLIVMPNNLKSGIFSMVESGIYAELVTRVIKMSTARQRPYSYFQTSNNTSSETYSSFISGHTSFSFAIATTSMLMLSQKFPVYKYLISITGLALASSVGYFRIAADRHYFTDVIGGAIVGTICGYAVSYYRKPWIQLSLNQHSIRFQRTFTFR